MKVILSLLGLIGFSLSATVAAPSQTIVQRPVSQIKAAQTTDVETWRKNLLEAKRKLDTSRQELKNKEEEVKKATTDFKATTVYLINAYEKEYERNRKKEKNEAAIVPLKINESDIQVD